MYRLDRSAPLGIPSVAWAFVPLAIASRLSDSAWIRGSPAARGPFGSVRARLVGDSGHEYVGSRRGGGLGEGRDRRQGRGCGIGRRLFGRALGRLERGRTSSRWGFPVLQLERAGLSVLSGVLLLGRIRGGEDAFEVEARDGFECGQIVEAAVVDHRDDRLAAIKAATQDLHRRVERLGTILDQGVVDGENRVEGRQLFEQAAPLVDAAHALHQQALGALRDHGVARDVLELDLEAALREAQQAVDRGVPLQTTHGRVDDLSIPEPDGGFTELGREVDRSTSCG